MKIPVVNLRAIEPEDLDVLYQIENDEALWDVGITNVPYSRYTLHDYIAQSAGDIYTDRQVRLMIENEQRQTVGIVDIVNFQPQHLRAEVGIVVQKPWRQRHYATAALEKVTAYVHKVLHLHQLYACVAEDKLSRCSADAKKNIKKSVESLGKPKNIHTFATANQ